MSWTTIEWDAFCGLLEEAWPGEFDDHHQTSYRVLLDRLEPQVATEGLMRLLYMGRAFRPSASELLAACRVDPSAPTFDEALLLIRRAMKAAHPAARLTAGHPLVASFVERQGWDRLRMLPLDDPDWGEKTRRELREAWDRHLDAGDRRQVAALASGGALKQLDPLASLQLGDGS